MYISLSILKHWYSTYVIMLIMLSKCQYSMKHTNFSLECIIIFLFEHDEQKSLIIRYEFNSYQSYTYITWVETVNIFYKWFKKRKILKLRLCLCNLGSCWNHSLNIDIDQPLHNFGKNNFKSLEINTKTLLTLSWKQIMTCVTLSSVRTDNTKSPGLLWLSRTK